MVLTNNILMNSKHFMLSMLAAFALAGCTNDDATSGKDDNSTISDGTPRYITVCISNTDGALQGKSTTSANAAKAQGTRANFQTGNADENTVNNVRFYFFNEDGSTASVKGSGSSAVNYLDWTPTTDETNGSTTNNGDVNVEKTLMAHLVINTSEGDRLPNKMLAVLNYDFTSSNGSKSLTQLREMTGNYATLAVGGTFVMANSVYSDNNQERISTTTITSNEMQTSEDGAKANPVQMYVERNVAKVTVLDGNATKTGNGNYNVNDAAGGALTIDIINSASTTEPKTLYFKLSGWGLTATTNKAWLSKHINPQWSFPNWTNSPTPGISSGRAWNDEANYRSYWAYNVITQNNSDGSGQVYDKSYNGMSTALQTYVYTNENAATQIEEGGEREFPTQVVVAGTLVDESGNPVTVGEFAGTYYTEDALKKVLYNNLALYTENFESGSTETRKKLDIKYLKFISESAAVNKRGETALTSQAGNARCYVELALNESSSDGDVYSGKLYTSSGKDATAYNATSAEVLTALKTAGQALLYENGQTYYWFKVKHFAEKDKGEYGVARNHMYNCKINSITGLGTPVFDPTETIYPETPVDVDTYIAAKINILSWRNVDSDVDLGK